MSKDREYIGPYKVYKIFRVSGRREIIRRGLSREEAKVIVNRYPGSTRHMVVFDKQYSGDRYYK